MQLKIDNTFSSQETRGGALTTTSTPPAFSFKKSIAGCVIVIGLGLAPSGTSSMPALGLTQDGTCSAIPAERLGAVKYRTTSDALQEIKVKGDFTTAEIANLFDVSTKTINNWLSGKKIASKNETAVHTVLRILEEADIFPEKMKQVLYSHVQNKGSIFDVFKKGDYTAAAEYIMHAKIQSDLKESRVSIPLESLFADEKPVTILTERRLISSMKLPRRQV